MISIGTFLIDKANASFTRFTHFTMQRRQPVYSTIENSIKTVENSSRTALGPKDLNECIFEKYRHARNGTHLSFSSVLEDRIWSHLKGDIEGKCLSNGLVLKTRDVRPIHTKTAFTVIPEHLNGTMVNTVKYRVSVYSPEKEERILLKVTSKCNLGIEASLQAYVTTEEIVASGSHNDSFFTLVEDYDQYGPIMAQLRKHPVQALLPLQLHMHCVADIKSLEEGDIIFATVKGKKVEMYEQDMSIVAVMESIFLKKNADEASDDVEVENLFDDLGDSLNKMSL